MHSGVLVRAREALLVGVRQRVPVALNCRTHRDSACAVDLLTAGRRRGFAVVLQC
jgi:hypothetical protein